MSPTLHTAVPVALALVLGALFGFGFYWLATKDRPACPVSPTPPAAPAAGHVEEFDEWEAHAHYPHHVLHAAHEPAFGSLNDYPPFGRHDEPATAGVFKEGRILRAPVRSLKTIQFLAKHIHLHGRNGALWFTHLPYPFFCSQILEVNVPSQTLRSTGER
ncbi:hypothetical protein [Burkholderia sp. AW49-1]